jgi:hypothetical protein
VQKQNHQRDRPIINQKQIIPIKFDNSYCYLLLLQREYLHQDY